MVRTLESNSFPILHEFWYLNSGKLAPRLCLGKFYLIGTIEKNLKNKQTKKILFFINLFVYLFTHSFIICFVRHGLSTQPWLFWNSLCTPEWLQTQRSTCLCFLSSGTLCVHHHAQPKENILSEKLNRARQKTSEKLNQITQLRKGRIKERKRKWASGKEGGKTIQQFRT